jgi:hypothetical protein
MRDTSQQQQETYFARLAALGEEGRGRIVGRLTSGVRRLAEIGIRQQFPTASVQEVRARLATRLYGRVVALRFVDSVPDDAV